MKSYRFVLISYFTFLFKSLNNHWIMCAKCSLFVKKVDAELRNQQAKLSSFNEERLKHEQEISSMKSYNQNLVKENKQLQVGTVWFILFVLCKWAVKLDENCPSVEQVTSSGIPWTTRSPIIEGVVQSFYSIFIWKRGITSEVSGWTLRRKIYQYFILSHLMFSNVWLNSDSLTQHRFSDTKVISGDDEKISGQVKCLPGWMYSKSFGALILGKGQDICGFLSPNDNRSISQQGTDTIQPTIGQSECSYEDIVLMSTIKVVIMTEMKQSNLYDKVSFLRSQTTLRI